MAFFINTAFWMFFFMVGFVATVNCITDFGPELVEKWFKRKVNAAVLIAVYLIFILIMIRALRVLGTTYALTANVLRNGALLYISTRIHDERVHGMMLVAVALSFWPFWNWNVGAMVAFAAMMVALQVVNHYSEWIGEAHAHFAPVNVVMSCGMWAFTMYAYGDSLASAAGTTVIFILVMAVADLYDRLLRYRRIKNKELTYGNNHDELTGVRSLSLFRRDYVNFFQKMMQEEDGQQVHLALLDIDHFKEVNDQFGHVVGDEALINFARNLEAYFIPMPYYASVYRTGGEEFSVLMYGITDSEARLAVDEFRAQLRDIQVLREDADYRLTMSAGIVPVSGAEEILKDLVKRADSNLYRAKNAGRNQVVQTQ